MKLYYEYRIVFRSELFYQDIFSNHLTKFVKLYLFDFREQIVYLPCCEL